MNASPTSIAANHDLAARLARRSRARHVLAVVILVVALVASCAWTLAVGRLGTPHYTSTASFARSPHRTREPRSDDTARALSLIHI